MMALDLIYDRTEADVRELEILLRALNSVTWNGLSDEQKELWNSPRKGAYNHTDRNRVGAAMAILRDMLKSCGYAAHIEQKTDWAWDDVPPLSLMEKYLDDVRILRSVLSVFPNTPEAPESPRFLNFQKANDIEKILTDIEALIINMVAGYRHCGTFYSGMEGLRL